MNIAQMRMMIALTEHKSMTITAKKLHVTQPALTYQLKVIEEELGFKVFERARTGTSLTEEGSFFCEAVRNILSEYDETVRLARAMSKGVAQDAIRIGVNGYSRDLVSFFLSVAPSSMSFTFIPCGASNPMKLLREGVIDFWSASKAAFADRRSGMNFLEIASVGHSAFVSEDHKLANRATLSIADLAEETIWTLPNGKASTAAHAIRSELERYGATVKTLLPNTDDVSKALNANDVVIYDDGYLPLPSSTIRQIPLIDVDRESLGLVYPKSAESRLAPTVVSLKERIANNPGREITSSELVVQRIASLTDEIADTVREGRMEHVVPLVEYGLSLGISAQHVLNRGLLTGMKAAEEAYRKGDINTTQMRDSVATANLAMDVLQPSLSREEAQPIIGTAVIGTAEGDMHDIGERLVCIMLESRNIEVTDLGKQASAQAFVDHLCSHPDCNLVLVSASTSEALGAVRDTMEALHTAGLRDQVFVMVGGSATSPEFANEIGADAFTASALEAANKASELLRL
ncbi:MAG: LysR family transcriptional regulator [Eggerthellaceae bacterium]|nr:LysR family transcriptional regulator [Eggerthellaceae bacterium]